MNEISEERQIFGTEGWNAERWLDEYGKACRSEAMDAEDEIIAMKIMAAGAEIRRLRQAIKKRNHCIECGKLNPVDNVCEECWREHGE